MLTIRWLLCRFSRVGQVVLCGDFYQVFLTLGLILTRFSLFFGDRFSIPTRTPAVHRAACLLRDLQSQPSLTLSYHSAFPRLPSLLTRPLSPPLSPLYPFIALRSPLSALRSPISVQPSPFNHLDLHTAPTGQGWAERLLLRVRGPVLVLGCPRCEGPWLCRACDCTVRLCCATCGCAAWRDCAGPRSPRSLRSGAKGRSSPAQQRIKT